MSWVFSIISGCSRFYTEVTHSIVGWTYCRNLGRYWPEKALFYEKRAHFLKQGSQKSHCLYSILFLSDLHQNKAFYNFRRREKRSIVKRNVGLEYALVSLKRDAFLIKLINTFLTKLLSKKFLHTLALSLEKRSVFYLTKHCNFSLGNHPFSTYAKYSEKTNISYSLIGRRNVHLSR